MTYCRRSRLHWKFRMRDTQLQVNKVGYRSSQFSMTRPRTRLNSLVLSVTSVSPNA